MNPDSRRKLNSFRVVELKKVLEKLALPTSGRKADLLERIRGYLGEGTNGSLAYGNGVDSAREQRRVQAAGMLYPSLFPRSSQETMCATS